MTRSCRASLAVAIVVSLAACRRPSPAAEPAPAPRDSYTVHEWGLFGLDIATAPRLVAASGSEPTSAGGYGFGGLGLIGTGAGGGKPVIYVHLDEGVDAARFTLGIGLPEGAVRESFPRASVAGGRLVFGPLVATRGRCGHPTDPPSPYSEACSQVSDHFCEAAEIPRYHGDDDTCLTVSGQSSELLFYRAGDLDPARLPLVLERTGETYAVRARGGAAVEGPVLFIERKSDGSVHYRGLASNEQAGPVASDGGSTSASETRALLLTHARRLGLSVDEADAFIDAWSPAIFDACHREGPDASGTPPTPLGAAEVSLLYFAPRALVDSMLPLTTDPPARRVDRAFLVRVVDSARPAPQPVPTGTYGPGHGIGTLGTPSAWQPPNPLHLPRPRIRMEQAVTRGGLNPDQVRRVLQRNLSQWMHCYEQGLQRDPATAGDVELAFVVAADGIVRESRVTRHVGLDAAVGTCAAGLLRRWSFPAPDPAGPVHVELTVHFTMVPPT